MPKYNLAFKKAFIEFVTNYYLGSFYQDQQETIDSLGLANAKLHGLTSFAGFVYDNKHFPHSAVVKQVHEKHYTVKDTYGTGNYPELDKSLHSKAESLKTSIRNYKYECAILTGFFNLLLVRADSTDLLLAYLYKLGFHDLLATFFIAFKVTDVLPSDLDSKVVNTSALRMLQHRKNLFDDKLNELMTRKQLFGW